MLQGLLNFIAHKSSFILKLWDAVRLRLLFIPKKIKSWQQLFAGGDLSHSASTHFSIDPCSSCQTWILSSHCSLDSLCWSSTLRGATSYQYVNSLCIHTGLNHTHDALLCLSTRFFVWSWAQGLIVWLFRELFAQMLMMMMMMLRLVFQVKERKTVHF